MRTLNLDHLKDTTLPGLSETVGAFLAEAALVCLVENGHQPGVKLKVSGEYDEIFSVVWSGAINDSILKNWKDLNEAVEYGATALALLLINELTEYTFLGRAAQMSVADYLLNKKNNPNDFEEANPAAYLEVSGIWKETRGNTLSMRLNLKKRKVESESGNTLPVFIFIAEFSVPKAKIAKV